MKHPLYKYPLSEMQVREVRMLKERPRLANYVNKRGGELGRVFRTKRVGDERRVMRVL